ncbi:MAG: hypothetical protein WBG46_08270 [Nonlabens sp.]
MRTEILNYKTEDYPFHIVISELIGESLSLATTGENNFVEANSFYKNMESVPLFEKMYSGLGSEQGKSFYLLYEKFIKNIIRPQFDESIYYQKKPSHRILFRDLKGEARFHRDSDYGHEKHEINYWVPQTRAFESNSIWIESKKGKLDYSPVNLEVGEYLKFHGAVLSHGAVDNKTDRTRVSFDFRVIRESDFLESLTAKGANQYTADNNPVRSNAHTFVKCK